MKHIIRAICRKDYHTATEGIFESLNTKAAAKLNEERETLREGLDYTGKKTKFNVAKCPECGHKNDYADGVGDSSGGLFGFECDKCGANFNEVRTGANKNVFESVNPRGGYMCPICESCWLGKDLVDGKLPQHRAFGRTDGNCPGSGGDPE